MAKDRDTESGRPDPRSPATADSTRTDRFCAALFREASLEFKLLAACCRWPTREALPSIARLMHAGSVDWDKFLDLGERHRVSGFAAGALRDNAAVPENVRAILASRAHRIEKENLLSVAVAAQSTRALEREGIPCLVMKGAPLAAVLLGNIGIRHSKDIDLLVADTDLDAAGDLLLRNGFRTASGLGRNLTARQAQDLKRFRKHHDFIHEATGRQLELHWRAYDNQHMGLVSIAAAECVECAPGIRLPTLPQEELFPLLCAHGASHAWFRLKWLADVAALLAQVSREEQTRCFRVAWEKGLERPAEQAQLLIAGLFDEDRIAPPQKSTATGRWLAKAARDALLQPIPAKQKEFVPKRLALSRMLLRRGWSYRIEEIRLNIASPADWTAVQLPAWLHFAYPLVRLPLWLRRHWLRGRGRSPQ